MLLHYLTIHKVGAVLIENFLLTTCVLLEAVLKSTALDPHQYAIAIGRSFAFALLFQLILHFRDAYDFRGRLSQLGFLIRLGQGIGLACVAISILYFIFPALKVETASLTVLYLKISALLTAWHFLLRLYFILFTRRSNVLILGTGRLARSLATEIVRRPEVRLAVCGFLSDDPSLLGVSLVNPKVIGLSSDLKRIVSERPVKKIVVELQDRRGRLPISELLELKTRGMSIEEATTVYERVTGKIAIENLKASWMIFSEGFQVSRWIAMQKTMLSFAVSSILSILFLPFLPLVALLIKLDSQGPVFHGQERVGQHGKVFVLWKFRSMGHDAERLTGPVWAGRTDSRVTRVGKFLRRTRLDELPQLYNVLKGDMSLVGPRPERPHFVQQLSETIPFYHLRHALKPGITGWAQINYGYGGSTEDAFEKLQYDLFYIKNTSFLLDAVIIFDTVKTVLVRKGS